MPRPFVPLTLAQFREMVVAFPFTRTVNVVHMHHTWRPRRTDYTGLATIEAMFDYHTRVRHFADIAQHVTIAPDGTIWTGRNWNVPPASATGHNGNATVGPFMFETIGNFDEHEEPFDGVQRETALDVIAIVQRRFQLAPEDLRFHRQLTAKTCPGSSIQFDELVDAVRRRHAAAPDVHDPAREVSGPRERAEVDAAIEAMVANAVRPEELAAAELPESDDRVVFRASGQITSAAARGVEVTEADLSELRHHVIDLNEGMLTPGGSFSSSPEDVERIFRKDMEQAFSDPESMGMPPRPAGETFRVMIWAHGGLISEKSGLAIATKHLAFWKKNGIYPIYFIWETGLLQTIGHLIRSLFPGGVTRNLVSDITDPLIERGVRAAGGEKVWSGMKHNSLIAATPKGGGTKTAEELGGFCARHKDAVDVHAAGHSAGANFHADFLPVAFANGLASVTSLSFLAPAVRSETFKTALASQVGSRIEHLGMFTMLEQAELDDNCATLYRKSLLYLIHFSLETEKRAEILGLEESIRRDSDLLTLFGLSGPTSTSADIVFSPSLASDGQHASRSTSHGGFDDDPATMNSIALRMLGLPTKDKLKMPYPASSALAPEDPFTSPEIDDVMQSLADATLGPAAAI